MPEEGYIPLYKPPLRRHRLVRASEAPLSADIPDKLNTGQAFTIGSSFPQAGPPAPLLAAQAKLAEDAEHLVEEVMPQLEALETTLRSHGVAEETVETLLLVCSALRVLPGELASGVEASVARVDWIFARLLNAPGQPGLIELVLIALLKPPAENTIEPLVIYVTEQEMLRRLHRDLVTLQQGWEDMLELTLPPEMLAPLMPLFPPLEDLPPAADEAPAAPPPLKSGPLPAGLVVAPGAGAQISGRARASAGVMRLQPARFSAISPVLAMALIVLVLALTGGGVYMMRNLGNQSGNSNNAAVIARLPSPTATTAPQPTTTPTSTPTPAPTSTPTPAPTSTPTATAPPTTLCTSDGDLCASVSSLRLCQSFATFKLTNNSNKTITWSSSSSLLNRAPLVRLSPLGGRIQKGGSATVTVSSLTTRSGQSGTLTISTSFGNDNSLVIPVEVC